MGVWSPLSTSLLTVCLIGQCEGQQRQCNLYNLRKGSKSVCYMLVSPGVTIPVPRQHLVNSKQRSRLMMADTGGHCWHCTGVTRDHWSLATCAPLPPSFLWGKPRLSELCPQWTSSQLRRFGHNIFAIVSCLRHYSLVKHIGGVFSVESLDAATTIEIPSNAVGTCPGRWWYWSSVKY